jgi:hypothetical protein
VAVEGLVVAVRLRLLRAVVVQAVAVLTRALLLLGLALRGFRGKETREAIATEVVPVPTRLVVVVVERLALA